MPPRCHQVIAVIVKLTNSFLLLLVRHLLLLVRHLLLEAMHLLLVANLVTTVNLRLTSFVESFEGHIEHRQGPSSSANE